ncbi:unnamed protein product [Colias eurytheme]|nr:unnamed protein product [Colias eurytheme]
MSKHVGSVTNIFLVNLSVADLLVTLFCMPVQISKSVTLLWYFGEVMCKTVNFLQGVTVLKGWMAVGFQSLTQTSMDLAHIVVECLLTGMGVTL